MFNLNTIEQCLSCSKSLFKKGSDSKFTHQLLKKTVSSIKKQAGPYSYIAKLLSRGIPQAAKKATPSFWSKILSSVGMGAKAPTSRYAASKATARMAQSRLAVSGMRSAAKVVPGASAAASRAMPSPAEVTAGILKGTPVTRRVKGLTSPRVKGLVTPPPAAAELPGTPILEIAKRTAKQHPFAVGVRRVSRKLKPYTDWYGQAFAHSPLLTAAGTYGAYRGVSGLFGGQQPQNIYRV